MRFFQPEDVFRKVKAESEQFLRTLENAGITNENTNISTWKLPASSEDFQRIQSNIQEYVSKDALLDEFLNRLSSKLLQRFVTFTEQKELLPIQKQYIIEETAVSIYMTEVFGTNIELYRREEHSLVSQLYSEHSDWLLELTGKQSLERKFVALEALMSFNSSG